jgi:Zn-dependent M16 (insulinase) family peptidase
MKGRANLLFPFPDYFTALSLALPPFASDDYPALLLAAKMIEIRCEKRQVLEHAKPGVVVQPTGVLTLFAQQDTHPISTVQILTTEVAKICGGRFTDDELEAARWAVFHEEDAPVPPSLRGMDHFLMAITEEMKTRHRDRILRTTRKKVAEVAKRTYASTDECNFGICVIGKKLTDIEDTNAWEFQYVAPI